MAEPVFTVGLEFVTGSYTNITSDVLRFNVQRQLATIYTPPSEGKALLELANESAKYSPVNSNSQYYPNILPGKNLRIQASHSGSLYNLFQGKITGFKVQPDLRNRTTIVDAADSMGRVNNSMVSTSLYINTNPASLFCAVMSACKVNSFAADAINDTIPYAWYQDDQASKAIQDILTYGAYLLYEDPAGTIQLKSRYFGLLSATVGSYSSIGSDGFFGLNYALNEDLILNRVKVGGSSNLAMTSQSTVAWLTDAPTIPASGGIGFWLSYVDPQTPTQFSPATSLQVPVSSSDWKLNTLADGTGTDKTSSGSLSVALFGEAAVCSIFNVDSGAVFLTKFQIRGFSVQKRPAVAAQADATSSQLAYGRRDFTLTNDFLGSQGYAQNYAQHIVDERAEPAPTIQISLKNRWPDILGLDLGNIVSLIDSFTAVNSSWTVQAVQHDVSLAQGLEHTTTYDVRFYNQNPWLVLDDPVRGVLDGARTLAF